MNLGYGIYSEETCHKHNGWYVFITKFTSSDDVVVYRWLKSKHRDQKDKYCLWCDKNPRGRKINTKYFLDHDECLEFAKSQCV